jgi:hypothetical protein
LRRVPPPKDLVSDIRNRGGIEIFLRLYLAILLRRYTLRSMISAISRSRHVECIKRSANNEAILLGHSASEHQRLVAHESGSHKHEELVDVELDVDLAHPVLFLGVTTVLICAALQTAQLKTMHYSYEPIAMTSIMLTFAPLSGVPN